jgi:hypothetical protein
MEWSGPLIDLPSTPTETGSLSCNIEADEDFLSSLGQGQPICIPHNTYCSHINHAMPHSMPYFISGPVSPHYNRTIYEFHPFWQTIPSMGVHVGCRQCVLEGVYDESVMIPMLNEEFKAFMHSLGSQLEQQQLSLPSSGAGMPLAACMAFGGDVFMLDTANHARSRLLSEVDMAAYYVKERGDAAHSEAKRWTVCVAFLYTMFNPTVIVDGAEPFDMHQIGSEPPAIQAMAQLGKQYALDRATGIMQVLIQQEAPAFASYIREQLKPFTEDMPILTTLPLIDRLKADADAKYDDKQTRLVRRSRSMMARLTTRGIFSSDVDKQHISTFDSTATGLRVMYTEHAFDATKPALSIMLYASYSDASALPGAPVLPMEAEDDRVAVVSAVCIAGPSSDDLI